MNSFSETFDGGFIAAGESREYGLGQLKDRILVFKTDSEGSIPLTTSAGMALHTTSVL